jgi:hypothetical protein
MGKMFVSYLFHNKNRSKLSGFHLGSIKIALYQNGGFEGKKSMDIGYLTDLLSPSVLWSW